MSYTIETLTSMNDDVFDTLYAASYPKIEEGNTMPWHQYDAETSTPILYDEKKRIFKEIFDIVLRAADDNNKVYVTYKDGTPIRMLNAGIRRDGVLGCLYQLVAPDSLGSRAWLYDHVLVRQTRDQFITDFDNTSHTMEAVSDSSMRAYYMLRPLPDCYSSIIETQADGISTMTVTYSGD